MSRPGVPLYWLEENGLDFFGASEEERSWHRPDGRGNQIIYDLPRAEAVNSIAPIYAKGDWQLSRVHWYDRQPMTAAAEYSHPFEPYPAYLPIVWVSMMDTQAKLFHRFKELPAALEAQAMNQGGVFLPAGLVVVGADEWGVARALIMARSALAGWVRPSHTTGWYFDDDEWHVSHRQSVLTGTLLTEIPYLFPPVTPLHPAGSVRRLGTRRFDRIIDRRSPWTGRAGRKLFELLTKLGQYPVGALGHYKAFVGEGAEAEARIKKLMDLGLAEIVTLNGRVKAVRLPKGVPSTISQRGQGGNRFALNKAGRTAFCNSHGWNPADLTSRTKMGRLRAEEKGGGVIDRWPYRHEDNLYEVLAQFSEMGCQTAPGWQAIVSLPERKRIEPDGKVLVQTPWGRLWCNLEIELSDRTYSAVEPRCKKFASAHRRDDDPVLFACHDDRAERNFHLAGAECSPPPRMLTTTLRRLKDGGVSGAGVWSRYGERITLVL